MIEPFAVLTWQAGGMEPWVIGLIALVAVGVAVIIYGGLRDRTLNRRRAEEMLAPPDRMIPKFAPGSAAPSYLSELQARRSRDEQSGSRTEADRKSIRDQLSAPDTVTIPTGYASKDFVTDRASGWAVLDHPGVLVCTDPVVSIRELLTVIEKVRFSSTALVIVAPKLAPDVRATLEVNAIRGLLSILAVVANEAERVTIAEATQADPVDRADRQAGYVDLARLGRCERWVSTAKASHLFTTPAAADLPDTADSDPVR